MMSDEQMLRLSSLHLHCAPTDTAKGACIAVQDTLDIETGDLSMASFTSRASFASSRHSKLSSLASSASLAAPSFTSLNRSEAVSTTLSELYKKHGNVSSAAQAYKKLVRQRTQDTLLEDLADQDEVTQQGASPAAIKATQSVMQQLTTEVEKATAAAARQAAHLRETQSGLDDMLAQLERMTMIWSREYTSRQQL